MLAIILAAATAALPAPVSGDFDRDGVTDVAALVAVDGGYDLIVRPGGASRAAVKVTTLKASHIFLAKAAPGVEATACAQGAGTGPCARKSVTLTGDTLAFGTPEASRAVALWTGERFEVVWLDD